MNGETITIEKSAGKPSGEHAGFDREFLSSAGIADDEEDWRRMQLAEARQEDSFNIREEVIHAAQALAQRLNREIAEGHDTTAFLIALLLAASKDGLDWLLDLVLIGEIPVIGQIPGIFLSAFLAYFLWGKGWFKRTKIKIVYYVLGLFFDNLPLLNNLPMNVLTVLWAWHVVRHRADQARGELENLKRKAGDAIGEIEETGEA